MKNFAQARLAAWRASILFFNKDPTMTQTPQQAVEYFDDGLLIVEYGKVSHVGDYQALVTSLKLNESDIDQSYSHHLIIPGFIDTHIHYAQSEMMGAYGDQLLPWLNKYTFPTEEKFADVEYAHKIAKLFIGELLKNGTTSALVFGTVHPQSVDALFLEADKKNMRLIAGKVMMDRNAPSNLCDTPKQSYDDSEKLIKRWHNHNRLLYAITPRFAPTSSQEQLNLAGRLKAKYPDVYVHSHLAENVDEVKWVESLFPEAKSYLDVYDRASLVAPRCVYAHGIHLNESDFETMNAKGAALSFCPSSNLFLGSGLFKIRQAKKASRPVKLGIGSDVGAGTRFSLLETLNDAYKVVSLEQNKIEPRLPLSSFEAFYQATLGGAQALYLDDKIGRLAEGYEADFIVLDWQVSTLQRLRMEQADQRKQNRMDKLAEKLFALMIMGDDRNIKATYVAGAKVWP